MTREWMNCPECGDQAWTLSMKGYIEFKPDGSMGVTHDGTRSFCGLECDQCGLVLEATEDDRVERATCEEYPEHEVLLQRIAAELIVVRATLGQEA